MNSRARADRSAAAASPGANTDEVEHRTIVQAADVEH